MQAWKRHQCNTCIRGDYQKRTDGRRAITDECKGYVPLSCHPKYLITKSCKRCGALLRGKHQIHPEQTTFVGANL